MFVIIIFIFFVLAFLFVPTLIKIFGDETFDENKVTGRTVRKTPEQKAMRFKFYLVGAFILVILFVVAIKSCSM